MTKQETSTDETKSQKLNSKKSLFVADAANARQKLPDDDELLGAFQTHAMIVAREHALRGACCAAIGFQSHPESEIYCAIPAPKEIELMPDIEESPNFQPGVNHVIKSFALVETARRCKNAGAKRVSALKSNEDCDQGAIFVEIKSALPVGQREFLIAAFSGSSDGDENDFIIREAFKRTVLQFGDISIFTQGGNLF